MINKTYGLVKITKHVLLYIILVTIAIVMLGPFLWAVSTSLKLDREIFKFPLTLMPEKFQFHNYIEAFQAAPFGRYFLNSFIVAISNTMLQLFVCSLAAYAFARLKFRGQHIIFLLILATLMIPYQITMIPLFIMLKRFPLVQANNIFGEGGMGLINTYWALILPGIASPFAIFLLRQFMVTLPTSLEDAARIDGCSEFSIYLWIVLPLCKPALAVMAILTFTWNWNSFIWPLIVTASQEMQTVQLGLQVFQTRYETDWRLLMAATTIITIPSIMVFLGAQKYFMGGITLTGLKE